MEILVDSNGYVVHVGKHIEKETENIWKITEEDGNVYVIGLSNGTKYEVSSLPEDYEDFKYYYDGKDFALNIEYYHVETEHRFAELDKINEDLSKQLELQAQAIMELAEIIGGE